MAKELEGIGDISFSNDEVWIWIKLPLTEIE